MNVFVRKGRVAYQRLKGAGCSSFGKLSFQLVSWQLNDNSVVMRVRW